MSALGILASCFTISVVTGVVYVLFCGCAADKERRVERRKRRFDVKQRDETVSTTRRKETFVRVGAETPEDDCEDPSPPLAVVQAPLKLGRKARK